VRHVLIAITVAVMILCFGAESMAQNYDAVLESLKKLDSTIKRIKEQYEILNTEPTQYVDVEGQMTEDDLKRDLMYDFAMDLEQVVADITQVMTDAQTAEAERPKNPAAAGHGKVTVTGYLHQQYYDDRSEDESSFISKRARLAIMGKLNDYASVKLMGEFAGSPKLLDGVMTISPNKYWSLSFGQYKPPFGTEFLRAASNWPFVNTTAVKKLGTDRDIGTHLTYKNSASENVDFAIMAGVFNGSGYNNSDANSDKNFVARGEFTINDQLTLAPNAYIGKTDEVGDAKESINTYGGSATWEWKNEILEGEYIYSKVGNTDKYGWHIWGGHTFKTNARFLPAIQVVARYATIDTDMDVDDNGTNTITLGTTLFVDGKYTKLQANYQFNGEEGTSVDNDEILMNIQVAF